jgi:leader peptidase (prepilin peptidase)/N-methyltransferase
VTWAIAALLGLVFGSFFNVCIWRIPLHQSIDKPPSHCPRCKKPIRAYDNIPVLSWLILRGRCRDCGKPISIRYPLVEAMTGLLFVAAYARFGAGLEALKAVVFVSLLIITAFIDLDHKIIPFSLSIPGLLLGITGGLLAPPRLSSALLGAAAGAAFVAAAWMLWRFVPLFRRLFGIEQKDAMGGGDLPYAAMMGAFLGPKALVIAIAAAVIFGIIIGYTLRALGRGKRGQEVPFGPFLALGSLVGLFFGHQLFAAYLRFVGLG